MTASNNKYPCPAPFSQLYVMPRTLLGMRFCSYHLPVVVPDQKSLFMGGPAGLNRIFNDNKELKRRRAEYLAGNFIDGAGCSPDCYWYCKWKETGEGFSPDEFQDEDGSFRVRKMWLTIGPDCNIFCRYCLDPEEFKIDYNTCDLQVMDLAREFVAEGGEILLTGGEPFLPKFRLNRVLEQLADRGGVKGEFEIHTNGTFLNAKNRALILRGPVKSVDVSMDTLSRELFEHLRKGANFDTVWGNILALKNERDALGLKRPRLMILCAVMTDTYDRIRETADGVVKEGLSISFNALFKAYYSPDFSSAHGLQNLGMKELEKLYADILHLEQQYGCDGPVQCQALKGQVNNLITSKRSGVSGGQVALGHGGEALRKTDELTLIQRGQYYIAFRQFLRKRIIPRMPAWVYAFYRRRS